MKNLTNTNPTETTIVSWNSEGLELNPSKFSFYQTGGFWGNWERQVQWEELSAEQKEAFANSLFKVRTHIFHPLSRKNQIVSICGRYRITGLSVLDILLAEGEHIEDLSNLLDLGF